ncbi:MAG TPA: hypothetical protein VGK67_10670 [Myxococcales bacterium]
MRRLAAMLTVALAAVPMLARAEPGPALRFESMRLTPPILLAQADAHPQEQPGVAEQAPTKPAAKPAEPAASPSAAPAPNLDFDLLGKPAQPEAQPAVDEEAVATRRAMLKVHQGLGIGLLVLQLSTVVLGQINYRDIYGGGDRSFRFKRPHQALAYTTFGLFVTNELIALLAPTPIKKQTQGVDRTLLHKIAMFTAMAGMVAEIVLGITSAELAGKNDQRDFAKAHLFIGYGTFVAMALGASAMIF